MPTSEMMARGGSGRWNPGEEATSREEDALQAELEAAAGLTRRAGGGERGGLDLAPARRRSRTQSLPPEDVDFADDVPGALHAAPLTPVRCCAGRCHVYNCPVWRDRTMVT